MKGALHITILILFFILSGCSTGTDILTAQQPTPSAPITGSDRTILAYGTIQFSLSDVSGSPRPETSLTVTFIPNREAMLHANVTPYLIPPECNDCVKIEVLEFTPSEKHIKLQLTLKNPTELTGYDVRGIVMTNDTGIRVTNPDAYTSLWDDGGAITKNPFRPLAYEVPGRVFEPGTEHSHVYDISYSTFGGLISGATLVVDASWPGHCKEAWDIREQDSSGDLAPASNSSVLVTCIVKDWQSDCAGVDMDLSSLGFPAKIPMNGGTDGIYWAYVVNQFSKPPGDYRIWLEAVDSKTNVRLYDDLTLTVSSEPPPGFTLKPGETFVDAQWEGSELSAYVTEYRLYKREKGQEYDYENPIKVAGNKLEYVDEDVLAGHMYFYKLSAVYELAESNLTEEHGAKPFLWGPVVQISDTEPFENMLSKVAIGKDGKPWIEFSNSFLEDFDNIQSPDWNYLDNTPVPGFIHLPGMAIGPDGSVHLAGRNLFSDDHMEHLRYMKIIPFIEVEKDFTVDDNIDVDRPGIAIDSTGKVYIIYRDHYPGKTYGRQAWSVTIDTDGTVSEPFYLSESGETKKFDTEIMGIFVDSDDVVHYAWLRGDSYIGPDDQPGLFYRRFEAGIWGAEERVCDNSVPLASQFTNINFWVDSDKKVHIVNFARHHYIRESDGIWTGSLLIKHHPTLPYTYGRFAAMAGDIDDNLLTVMSFNAGEISFVQVYGNDQSDDYYLTSDHTDYSSEAIYVDIATGPDGLAVVTWTDSLLYGRYEIFARKEILE